MALGRYLHNFLDDVLASLGQSVSNAAREALLQERVRVLAEKWANLKSTDADGVHRSRASSQLVRAIGYSSLIRRWGHLIQFAGRSAQPFSLNKR